MVSRWEDEFPSEPAVLLSAPQPEDIAISVVHKVFLLVTIVALIAGVWALTSGPAAGPDATDATLGPPMGPSVALTGSGTESR